MAASDPVETKTPVFTEEEVYLIGGFLAGRWREIGDTEEEVADIENAILAVLNRGR